MRECTPHQHVEAVRHWGLKWAWPHDGRNQTLSGAGVPLMRQYESAGLDMMPDAAKFEDGGNSVEAGRHSDDDRREANTCHETRATCHISRNAR
jgi:hypothetical protein